MAVILLPLFFINVKDSHNWGDEFAMYIMQTDNLVNGEPQSQTPYIYNPENPFLGPPAYPIGFPLILSPVYAISGNSIYALSLWITAFLFGLGMILTVFLRKHFNDLITFFLVLIIIYNPWTLNLKMEIIEVIPFTFLLFLAVYLFEKYAQGPFWVGIIIAFIGGLLMSTHIIGMVFPLAVLIWAIRKRFIEKDKTPVNKCVCGFLVSVGSLMFYLLLNKLIFPIPAVEGGAHAGIWGHEKLYATVLYSLDYYTEEFIRFFTPHGGSWQFLPLMLGAGIFTFTVLGMIKSFFKRLDLIDMIVILYLGLLLIYPDRYAGIRRLFPIMPFLVIYLVRGLQTVKIYPGIKQNTKAWFLGILVLVSYLNMIWFILKTDNETLEGPQQKASIEAFQYIRENTAPDAIFLFAKPRALALYTEHRALANNWNDSNDEIEKLINEFEIDYLLEGRAVPGTNISSYAGRSDAPIELVWDNDKFFLFRVVK